MFTNRNVVTGLEGCGKSSQIFQYLSQVATRERPILFSVKNYKLMQEQVSNWSSRFCIPIDEFAICGFNLSYEPAKEAYTNKEIPFEVGKNVRFIFTSQAIVQRNRHTHFINTDNKPVEYSHIVVDEFDFTSGIVPALDYELANMRNDDIKQNTEKQKLRWIADNYTAIDMNLAIIKKMKHDNSFSIAHWIESSKCPITFLTSEVLATRFLKLLSFKELVVKQDTASIYKDCVVNTWSSEYIGRNFFNKMNQYVGWNKLSYDLVISDCVNSYYERKNIEDETNGLDIAVVSHTAIRGSNDWIDKKILTVLSHIPKQALTEIRDTFHCFNDNITYEEVESLFYRDRLCQAIGRVIGNRGGKETDIVIHKDILNAIDKNSFPYTFNTDWEFNFEGFDFILEKVIQAEQNRKERQKIKTAKASQINKIQTYSYLDSIFIKAPNNYIPVADIKEYLVRNNILDDTGKGTISATKIAEFFGVEIANIKPLGRKSKTVRVIKGITYR